MPTVIEKYSGKRVTDYLRPGMRVLIAFDRHGIGDMIMFYPLYQRLKELYPEVEFHLRTNRDQHYFEESPDAEVDMVFKLSFNETANNRIPTRSAESKAQRCALHELGIPFDASLDFTWRPKVVNSDIKIGDNCIGFVFQIQSAPLRGLSIPGARNIWHRITARGFRPIEVTFMNPNHNGENKRPGFATYSCRDFEASEENMISVIQQCKGFVGVNTGTFCAATCIMNEHVLHLYTGHYHFSPWYKRYNPVPEMDCSRPGDFEWSALDKYLDECKFSSN